MTSLADSLVEYLTVRRKLGYRFERQEKLLKQYLSYLDELGHPYITVETAVAWATLPVRRHQSWYSYRLSAARGFAAYQLAHDPRTEVPAPSLLPWRRCPATPYLYTDADLAALIAAAKALRTPHRAATYQTLVGLLAVTGMRVGEAIALNRNDFDVRAGVIVVRNGKFGKTREVPLHASTVTALSAYVQRHDRPQAKRSPAALLISDRGTRLEYRTVQWTFSRLVSRAGVRPRSPNCRPRLHDLRHGFAVQTMQDAYRDGGNAPQSRLPLLSTYLGHVDPGKTYWYLSAAPELLELAGERLAHHLGGDA
jgi:integrase